MVCYCCNFSTGVALNVQSTMNGMCTKNNTIYMWREQAIIEWSCQVNSTVACCHNAKLSAHAAWAFLITKKLCCDQDVKVVPGAAFTQKTCNWCGLFKRRWCCCNLSAGVALNAWFSTNRMYVKNNTMYMWHEQAVIE